MQAAGYNYLYTETIAPSEADYRKVAHVAELFHSLGFQAAADGILQDAWIGSPAYLAGLGPVDKITSVNGKPYTPEVLTSAVKEAKTTTSPITLTAMRDVESKTIEIPYPGGEQYAALVRNSNPDLLTILQPR